LTVEQRDRVAVVRDHGAQLRLDDVVQEVRVQLGEAPPALHDSTPAQARLLGAAGAASHDGIESRAIDAADVGAVEGHAERVGVRLRGELASHLEDK